MGSAEKEDGSLSDTGIVVYIVKCADGSLYTGWTNDIDERIKAHNEKRSSKYTWSRRPVELVYAEAQKTKSDALKRERQIKQMTRAQKLRLISHR